MMTRQRRSYERRNDVTRRHAGGRHRSTPAGMDVILGQQLYNRVRRLGFTSMASEGQTCMFEGGSPAAEAYRLTMEQLSDSCVATGEISAQEFADFLKRFSNPSCVMRQFLLMSVWARKPTA